MARHVDALSFLCRALHVKLPGSNRSSLADLTEADINDFDTVNDSGPNNISSLDYLRGSNYTAKFLSAY